MSADNAELIAKWERASIGPRDELSIDEFNLMDDLVEALRVELTWRRAAEVILERVTVHSDFDTPALEMVAMVSASPHATTPAPVSGGDREALIATIYTTPTPLGVLPGSTWPFPVSVTELADAILAAGFSRSPAVQVDAAKVLEEAANDVERMYAGSDGSDIEKAWIGGVDAAAARLREIAAALRSPTGDDSPE